MAGPLTIGVDIGGTKVAAALVDPSGEITHRSRTPMNTQASAEDAFLCVETAIEEVFAQAPEARKSVQGIGVCSPGPLDPFHGVVLNPPNLPCWRNYPLAAEVESAFRIPARVDNDANVAGLAEAIWGAGKGYKRVFFSIVGTGVGTGVCFDRQIYYGRTGTGPEGGHVTINFQGPRCGCGKLGCIEAYASGPNIARRAQAKLVGGAKSKILTLAGSLDAVRTEHVGAAYGEGDSLAAEVLNETAHYLTIWLGTIVDLLEPDVMVIGGGVAELMSSFFPGMSAKLPEWCVIKRAGEIPLVLARFKNDAGIIGAAALFNQ